MRGEGLGGGARKENKKTLGYEDYVYSLDYGLVSQEYTHVKIYKIVHFKHVRFIVSQLDLNKAVFKNTRVTKK